MIVQYIHSVIRKKLPSVIRDIAVVTIGENEGDKYIAAANQDKNLYILTFDGLEEYQKIEFSQWVRSVTTADLTKNGNSEILVGLGDNTLRLLRFDEETRFFTEICSERFENFVNTCAIADLNGDSNLEIIAGSWDKTLRVFSYKENKNKADIEFENEIENPVENQIENEIENETENQNEIYFDASIDSKGNLWIGTSSGLAYRDAVTSVVTAYTTDNCDLVSDRISGLFLNGKTGDLFVATDAGMSILISRIRHRTIALDSVAAIPNPFVIRSDSDRMEFNYNKPGTVRLYTVAGEPVVDFPVNSSWGGRNSHGRKVASGVYIFILTGEDGNMARGKVLVVRNQ